MAKWEQTGGDVNPKNHGAVLTRRDGDYVEIVKIEPRGDSGDDATSWDIVENSFHVDDLTWTGNEDVASYVGASRSDWLEFSPEERAQALLDYSGGDNRVAKRWSDALPVASNSIKWWR